MSVGHPRKGGWDRLRISGKPLPGRVKSLQLVPSADISLAKSKGVNGPRLKSEGYAGSTVELVLEVWSTADIEAVDAELEPLRPSNAEAFKTPQRIDHPLAYLARVEYIASAKITWQMPVKGRWDIGISMLQWFPPEEKTKAAGTATPPPDNTEIDTGVPEPDPANVGAEFP